MGLPAQTWILAILLVSLSSNAWGGSPPDFVLQWGSNGGGDGQFSGPHGIEGDVDGALDHTAL